MRALQIYEGSREGGAGSDERIGIALEPAPERVPDGTAPSGGN